MDFTILKDIVLSVGALGGLGLGIYNYLRDKKKDEVDLVVKPLSIHMMGDSETYGYNEEKISASREFKTIGVKVINLSKFDITISEIGFKIKNDSRGERIAFPNAMALTGDRNLPARLPSRESVVIAFNEDQLPAEDIRLKIDSVYITTGCDLFFVGSSGVIEDFKKLEVNYA